MTNSTHTTGLPSDPSSGKAAASAQRKELRNYLIENSGLRAAIDRQDESALYSLREEIQLVRALISKRLESAKSEAEQLVAFNSILPAISTLDKLINSLHRMEVQTSMLLGRDAVLGLARKVVEVLGDALAERLSAEDRHAVVDAVSVKLLDYVKGLRNE